MIPARIKPVCAGFPRPEEPAQSIRRKRLLARDAAPAEAGGFRRADGSVHPATRPLELPAVRRAGAFPSFRDLLLLFLLLACASPAAAQSRPQVTLLLSSASISENAGTSTVTAQLDRAAGATVTVTVSAAGVSPATADDFTLSAGRTLTIRAGSTASTGTVTITAENNDADAPDKEVTVSGTATGGNAANPAAVTLTITDDEAAPTVTLTATPSRVMEATGIARVFATQSHPSSEDTRVTLTQSTTDYRVTGRTGGLPIIIRAGQTESAETVASYHRFKRIRMRGNDLDEPDRTVTVLASAANGQGIGAVTGASLTVVDDDPAPTVTLTAADNWISENGGTTTVSATLSHLSTQATTITLTAPAGTTLSGTTLTVPANATASTGTVTITAVDNARDGPNPGVTVSGTARNSQGVGTVTGARLGLEDDDGASTVSLRLSAVSISENAGTSTVTARLDQTASTTVTVTVSATGVSPASGDDFTLSATRTLTIAAGSMTSTGEVTITAVNNDTDAPDKEVTVSGTVTSGGLANPASAALRIRDDDRRPRVRLRKSSPYIAEQGITSTAITATLDNPSSEETTITVSISAYDSHTRISDFQLSANRTLTIPAGQTTSTGTVTITSVDDNVDQSAERTALIHGAVRNARGFIGALPLQLNLYDDEGVPRLQAIPRSVSENSGIDPSGQAYLHIRFETNSVSDRQMTVDVAVDSMNPGTATAGTDYLEPGRPRTVSIPAYEDSAILTVTVRDDNVDELNETIRLRLSNPVNVQLATPTVTGTIIDDDPSPTVSLTLDNVSVMENGGRTTVSATMSHASTAATTVTVTAVPGKYAVGTDATITIPAGRTSSGTDTATITAIDNQMDEPHGTVTVTGTATSSNRALDVTGAELLIVDDEAMSSLAIDSPVVTERTSGPAVTMLYTVWLLPANAQQVTVKYAVNPGDGGTATSGVDYMLSPGMLTFAAGETRKQISVAVPVDGTDEPNETLKLRLSEASSNAALGKPLGIGTIIDVDEPPRVLVQSMPPKVPEGHTTTLSARLSHRSSQATTVTVRPVSGGYTVGSPNTITIAAGSQTATGTVSVTAVDNNQDDDNRVIPFEGQVQNSQGVGRISWSGFIVEDNDDPPTVTLALTPSAIDESDQGARPSVDSSASVVTARLSHPSSEYIPVLISAAPSTNARRGDYRLSPRRRLIIRPSTVSSAGGVSIAAVNNNRDEAHKSVTVSGVVSGTVPMNFRPKNPTSVTLAIRDDDGPTISIDSPSVSEGATNAKLTYTVRLSASSPQEITVNYALDGTDGGTAASGTDYTTLPAGTLTFATGQTSKTIEVSVTNDTTDEPDETVRVTLSGPSNATLGSAATGVGTITDDDDPPTVGINSPSVTEGNDGATDLDFTVSLSAASGKAVTVNYALDGTDGGTATSGTDYEALAAGTATIAAGDTSTTVTVKVTGDTADEPNETVRVTLGSPSNATLDSAKTTGVGTITDDDAAPTVTLALTPSTIDESDQDTGEDDSSVSAVSATLSHASAEMITVTVAAATGTNAASGDYTLSQNTTLTIAAGATSSTETVTVSAVDNAKDEADKQVTVSGTVSGGVSGSASANPSSQTLTITDDDAAPTVTLALTPSTIDESDQDTGEDDSSVAAVSATLSHASAETITVVVAAATGTNAASGDYTLSENTTLTIAAGATSSTETVTVSAVDNAKDEADKQVTVSGTVSGGVSGSTSADPSSQTLTITDDDAAPTVTLALTPATIDESDQDAGTPDTSVSAVSARLSHASAAAITLSVAAAAGSNAVAGDFALSANTALTIAAGDTASAGTAVTVSAVDNAKDEADKQVTVSATVSGGVSGSASADPPSRTLTIRDDDGAPTVGISSPSVAEGDSGEADLVFTVSLSAVSGQQVTVNYALDGTDGGTAASGTDYAALSPGRLTFAAGDRSKTVTVKVRGDTVDEPDETVRVTLSGPSNATLGSASTGVGTITDDDAAPTVSIGSASAAEGDSGEADLVFTVSLSAASGKQVTVKYAVDTTDAGTATSGADYTAVTETTLTFAVGDTSRTATVKVQGDTTDEPDETVRLTLSEPGNATLGSASTGVGTITDDDAAPTVSIGSASVAEGDSGEADLDFTVSLSAASGKQVTVKYAVDGTDAGTATSGADYAAVTETTLTFAVGDTSRTATVRVKGDTTDEPDETVRLTLSAPGNATLGSASTGVGTITDDDAAPTVGIDSPSVAEGDSGQAHLDFTVSLSAASGKQVTVNYAPDGTDAGTATSGTDYTAVSQTTLTFAAGETSKRARVLVTGDTADEPNETVRLTLSGPTNATLGSASTGVGTITDDDAAPTVTLALTPATIDESDQDAGTPDTSVSAVSASLSHASAAAITVSVAAAAGTNAASGDFALSANTALTIAAGDTASTGTAVTVSAVDNAKDEADKQVTVSATVSGGVSGSASADPPSRTLTIRDDDGAPTVGISSPSVAEGDSGEADLVFTVSLSAASGQQVTVNYALDGTDGGTAASGADYAALSPGRLTFAAGDRSKTVTVKVRGDTVDEPDETVRVTLSGPSNATLGSASTGVGTITDDDAAPTVSIGSASVAEGDSGEADLDFTVSLSAASGKQVTVKYAVDTTDGGTATSGADYTAVTETTLTFAVGDTSKTATVKVKGDTTDEPDETVRLTLSEPGNATLGSASTGVGTIADDDAAPTVSIGSASVAEGDSGEADLDFTVSLSAASGKQVTVKYAVDGTDAGTATSGADYAAVTETTLTFAVGDTSRTATVRVKGDTTDEPDETVRLTLSAPGNATLGSASTGVGTITDDDAAPTVGIDSPSVAEGDSGQAHLDFTVSLSAASGKQVTVNYAPDGTDAGTATSGTDYTAVSQTTLTFAAGETSKRARVLVTGDTADEPNETVRLTLSGPTNATLGSASTGVGTITDDDAAPTVTLALTPATIDESDQDAGTPDTSVSAVSASLSHASAAAITVSVAAAAGTNAASGDFALSANTALTIAAGDTASTGTAVTVSAVDNAKDEADKQVTVSATVSGGVSGSASADPPSRTLTIRDDDGAPTVGISSPSVAEGDSGEADLVFTVSLSAASGQQVTVNYALDGTDGGTAASGADYAALSPGRLTFAAGDRSKTVTVKVRGDTVDEPDETVRVTLSGPSNATLGSASTGVGTITDDDAAPTVSIGSASVAEGDSGEADLDFTVSLSAASGKQVTVKYAVDTTDGGTATSGADYTAVTETTLTFAVGDTSKTATVKVKGDTTDEPDETVRLTLSEPGNATLGSASTGVGTIADDDAAPTVSIGSASVAEGDSGEADLDFTVSLSAASGKQVTVKYAVDGTDAGTATSGADYAAVTETTLTFAVGDTSRTATVRVKGDTTDEPDETVRLTLSAPGNATLGSASTGVGTITDDDAAPTVGIDSPSVAEGDSGQAHLDFTVSLSAASGKQVTVNYAPDGTDAGTATSGTDYTAVSQTTLTFAAGETSKRARVLVTGDTADEPNETVRLTLSGPTNATLGSASTGVGTITDDDAAPTVTLALTPATIDESDQDAGTPDTSVSAVSASLSHASAAAITVSVAAAAGTNAVAGDFALSANTALTIAAGDTASTGTAVTVSAVDNAKDEADKQVTVSATVSGGVSGSASADPPSRTLTIRDDDGAPTVGISSPSVAEGDSGEADLVFTVSLSAASGQQVTVNYALDGTDGGTAASGADYAALSPGRLTFAAGDRSKTVTVKVRGDTVDEPDETVRVTLSGPSNATLGSASTGVGTITDDDAAPTVSIGSASVAEGDSGEADLDFTVSLSAASGKQVTVKYAVDGTDAGTATAGADYTAVTETTLTFAVGDTSKTATVKVKGDTTDEPDETVRLTLSEPGNATLGSASTGVGTIADDDAAPTVSISSPSVAEGNSGQAHLDFTVSLSAASGKQVTVNYAVDTTDAGTATSGTDYTAVSQTTLTFAAGETSKRARVLVTGDTTDEPDETVRLTLSAPGNATLGAASTGVGTITDDDAAPTVTLSVSPGSIAENGGTAAVSASLTGGTTSSATTTVTVSVSATGGYTVPGSANTITITAGSSSGSGTVTITAADNDIDAADLSTTVTGTATNSQGLASTTATAASLTITDDDTAALTVSAGPLATAESGTTATFTVRLATEPTAPVTVAIVSGDTGEAAVSPASIVFGAAADADANPPVAAWDAAQTVTVTGQDDDLADGAQSYAVTVDPSSADALYNALQTVSRSGSNADNDTAGLALSEVASPRETVSEAGTTAAFRVALATEPTAAVTVAVSSDDGGECRVSKAGDSGPAVSTTLTFAANAWDTAQEVTVTGVDDDVDDGDQDCVITADASSNGDSNYNSNTLVPSRTVAVRNSDNDTAALTVSKTTVSTDEDGGTDSFTVALASEPTATVTVAIASSDTDEARVSPASIKFGAAADQANNIVRWDATQTVTVTGVDDDVDDDDKSYTITVSSTSSDTNYSGLSKTVSGTSVDDEAAPTVMLSLSRSEIKEAAGAQASERQATVTARLSHATKEATTVTVSAAAGANAAADDFALSANKVLTIDAGDTSSTGTAVTITAVDDRVDSLVATDDQGNGITAKLVTVSGSVSGGNGASAPSSATLRITEDDLRGLVFTPALPAAASNPRCRRQGNCPAPVYRTVNESGNGNTATFQVKLATQPTAAVTVAVSSQDESEGLVSKSGDAAPARTTTLRFTTGNWNTNQTVTLTGVDDRAVDGNQDYLVRLNPNAAATDVYSLAPRAQALMQTTDTNTAGLTVSETTVSTSEASGPERTDDFTVRLDTIPSATVTVDVASSDTDEAEASPSSIKFGAAADSANSIFAWNDPQTVTVTGQDDDADEDDKPYTITVRSASADTNYSGLSQTVSGTNADDDDPPTVSIGSASVAEGDSGEADLDFTVSLSAASGKQVTVKYAVDGTDAGTATSGADYTAVTETTLTFAAGQTSRTVTVKVQGDTTDEPDETVRLTLSEPANATLGSASTGVGTITDDDGAPTVSISSPSVAEGDTGSANLDFMVSLSAASGKQVTVKYAPATDAGTATAGTDYTAVSQTTLTFAAGETSETVRVLVTGDATDEPDETVRLTLSGPTNATLGSAATGVGTITDDDAAPTVSIGSASVAEGDSGEADLDFTVSLSAASGKQVTVNYAVDGTDGGTATSGTDYAAVTETTLTFAVGDTSKTATVRVKGDTTDEPDETVRLTLSAPGNATLGSASTGVGTITDDDAAPTVTLSLTPSTIDESDQDAGTPDTSVSAVSASLSHASAAEIRVSVAAAAGSNAASGDFALSSNTALSITAGSTASTEAVTVSAVDNAKDEADKQVTVSGTVSGGVSGSASADPSSQTLTIRDDDGAPTVGISSPSVAEGDSGEADLVFTVSLSAASGQQVTVNYALDGTDGGTAASGTDYAALSPGRLTFAAGDRSKTVTVKVRGDTVDEQDETVRVTLSGPTNATLGSASTGVGTITDDDAADLVVSESSVSTTEASGAGRTASFTVKLASTPTAAVTVSASVTGGDTDEAGVSPTSITFGAAAMPGASPPVVLWSAAQTVTVTGADDSVDDDDKSYTITVSSASSDTNYSSLSKTVSGTNVDDEAAPTVTLSLSRSEIKESAGAQTAERRAAVTATLSHATKEATTVTVSAAAAANAAADDFALSANKTLTIDAGNTTSTGTAVTITAVDDRVDSLVETDDQGNAITTKLVTVSGSVSGGNGASAPSPATLRIAEDDLRGLVFTPALPQASRRCARLRPPPGCPPLIYRTVNESGDGGTATFQVKLATQPTVAVAVAVSSQDESEGLVSQSGDAAPARTTTLRFTTVNWNANQAVTLTGVDDRAVDGNQDYLVRLNPNAAATDAYSLAPRAQALMQTTDTSAAGLTVSETSVSTSEASGTARTDDFTVRLDTIPSATVTVDVASSDTDEAEVSPSNIKFGATADPGNNIFAWNDPQTVTVTGQDDDVDEDDKPYTITVRSASTDTNYSGLSQTVSGTNADDDDPPTVSISSPSLAEGDSGEADLDFTVSLSAASGKQVTVKYAVDGTDAGTATSGTDYTAVTETTLTFTAGQTSRTVTVKVKGDTTDEPNETVRLTLSEPANATLGSASTGVGTITDDDGAPTVSIGSASVAEGDSGSANLDFMVSLSAASGKQVTVKYAPATNAGTATAGTDYTAVSQTTLTFAVGETSKRARVLVTGDTTDEPDETVRLTLSGPTNATLGSASTGVGTITDDDDPPTVSIGSASVAEGDSGEADLDFTVSLSAASGKQVTVKYAVDGTDAGTATSGTDYTAVTETTLTFAVGDTSKTVTVKVKGDTLNEPDETVRLTLSEPGNATLGSASTGVGTITDDDGAPTVSISSPSVAEGNTGSANLDFMVTLSAASGRQVTVKYAPATDAGTATSGTDYTAVSQTTLTFAAGETSKRARVLVTGDTTDEPDETVRLTLSGPNNATLDATKTTGVGTITDDDDPPTVSIGSPSVAEGDSGEADLDFTVSLSAASGKQVTVKYAVDGTDAGTATAGTDYEAVTETTLTFAAGDTSKTVTVKVKGDTLNEPNETVRLTLNSPTNATLGSASTGVGTITDDDGAPTVSISSPSVAEGDSGSANLDFMVTLSAASGQQVTVKYAPATNAGTATSGTDYTAVSQTTLTFAAGETSKTARVLVTGDTTDEPDETVRLTLSGPTNATLGSASTGTGTITDDDDPPTVSIGSPSVTEGDSGEADLDFTVSLSAASGKQVTVKYAVDGTDAGTATSGTDYTAVTETTLTFAAGQTSKTVTVKVKGDTLNEPNETVRLTLSEPSNATLGSASTGVGTITDDDGAPTVSISSPSVAEGDSGQAHLDFTVSLSAASGRQVTVKYAPDTTDAGTATAGSDYTAVSQTTLTFAAGETSKRARVLVTGDAVDEPDETVRLTLSGPNNATLDATKTTGVGTITDDDDPPTVSIGSPSVAEGDSGEADLDFTVSLSAASGKQVTVKYAVDGTDAGTATSGTDYDGGDGDHADIRGRRHQQDGDGEGEGRHPERAERDGAADAERAGQRDAGLGVDRGGDDHGRRRRADGEHQQSERGGRG